MTEQRAAQTTSVRAAEDLYRHVNGSWLAETTIRDDRALEGTFTALRDASEEAVRDIITEAAAAEPEDRLAAKIGDLFAAFMDEEAIEAKGLEPILGRLAKIRTVSNTDELMALSGSFFGAGVHGPFSLYAAPDAGDPERVVLYLNQGGLGLPDESYYRLPEFAQTLAAYQDYVAAMLRFAKIDDAEAQARKVVALETRLAAQHLDKVSQRDAQKTYNPVSAAQLQQILPAFGLWAQAAGISESQRAAVVLDAPEFFASLPAALAETELSAWQSWLTLRVINAAAPYLHREVNAANFAFYGTTLSGTPQQKERWKRGVAVVEDALGEAVGELYVSRHFPPAHKERMQELVAQLVQAYRESITALSWMSEETKEEALRKLSSFRTKIGYPEEWIDYSDVEISREDLMGSVESAIRAEIKRNLDEIGQPVDRNKWLMTPQTVNAYYHPLLNEIVFPAAILQPPFFDISADDAWNYGAIGAVIGHEIGHGFDDQGSQYDGTGALRNWWQEADRTAFEGLTGRLVSQFNALEVAEAPGSFVNGELTLGENIGDLGGLGIAYRAYQRSLNGAAAPELNGHSGTQRFFIAWATGWRQQIRSAEAKRRVTVDPHSPNEFRTNAIVKNLDAFHEAFDVREGDGMWLAPEERVSIW